MVAEFVSSRPVAAIADSNASLSSKQPKALIAKNLSDRRNRALAQLEAALEGCGLADDEQFSVWTAFREMLDTIDELPVSERPIAKPTSAQPSSVQPNLVQPDRTLAAISPSCAATDSLDLSPVKALAKSRLLSLRSHPAVSELDTRPTWNEVVVVFGQEIQRIRQAQNLSLDWIHFKTQVPLYQLRALESGAVSQLPEEIFVRGFLARICAQLGAEGQALLAQLPAPCSAPQAIFADWQQLSQASSRQSKVLHLRSSHLYISYAALLAGATGGLAWSFQETAQIAPVSNSPQILKTESNQKATLNLAQRVAQLAFGSNIAQPERSAPETMP